MPIRAGFHVEGNDHLILHALVAKMLVLPEEEIEVDFIDAPGRGWEFVLEFIPRALKRFYGQCAQFAVIGVDNDGNVDLDQTGLNEDPRHPRHSNHLGATRNACRYCMIAEVVARIRPQLNWVPKKLGAAWPVLVAVPVEMIETWLLTMKGSPSIQRRPRSIQKQLLYGKPVATRADVISIAIPLIRSMTSADVASLVQSSSSFRDFHDQIAAAQQIIRGATDCW
ncbi:MAG: hypothetical protein LAP21_05825 [Acidobacteriia bacterium]|nr:hypothetical protein [Terriglobia bacterium]